MSSDNRAKRLKAAIRRITVDAWGAKLSEALAADTKELRESADEFFGEDFGRAMCIAGIKAGIAEEQKEIARA